MDAFRNTESKRPGDDRFDALIDACINKDAEKIAEAIKVGKITQKDVLLFKNHIFDSICNCCELGVVKWFVKRFDLTRLNSLPIVIEALETLSDRKEELGDAGIFSNTKWLIEHFEINADEIRGNNNWIIRHLCFRGRLETAAWLTERFKLNAFDICELRNWTFKWACAKGNLRVAEWIFDHFKLSAEQARDDNNGALRYSCLRGREQSVRWLFDHCGLTKEDIKTRDHEALRWSADFPAIKEFLESKLAE